MLPSRLLRRLSRIAIVASLSLTSAVSAQVLPTIAPDAGLLRPLETADDVRGLHAVGRLDTGVSFCSGTLIAPRLVLTAAHCLFDAENNRIPDTRIQFAASLRHGRAEALATVSRSFIPPRYTRGEGRVSFDVIQDDIALLELTQPITSARVAPIPTGAMGRMFDLVTVVSYGRDRANYASVEEDCEILATERPVHVLSCTVVEGSSGAPILRQTGAGYEVIAVVSAVGEWDGDDATIAVSVDGLLPDLMSAYEAASSASFGQTGVVRHISVGEDSRDGIGARFVRP